MEVTVIEATRTHVSLSAGKPDGIRTAAYCRVSSNSDEQETSYEAQCMHYLNYINSNPSWTLAGIFADEGITGTQAKRRPEFQRLIAECEAGHIDQVITKSISRFARNTLDCLNYIRKLKALGIPIIFEKESINTMDSSGEVLVTILASIAQQESASISANVRMGIEFGFQEGRGRLNYSTFLGYVRGDTPGSYVIVPHEADVVRRIYREYLEGFSPYMTCERLMRDGVPAPAGGPTWHPSTVSSILQNEKYCGDLLMQKYYTEDYLTHRTVRNVGQRPQYFVEDDHDPIVPKAVFYQVQGERRRRSNLKNDPSKLRYGNRLALNGRLVCGKCGRTLKRYVKPSAALTDWRCRRRAMVKLSDACKQPQGCRCDCRIVKELDVQRAVVQAFCRLPHSKEDLLVRQEHLRSGQVGRIDALLKNLNEQQDLLERRLKALAATDGGNDDEAGFVSSTLEGVGRRKNDLYAQRANYASQAVKVRLLLEFIDHINSLGGGAARPVANPPVSPACYDYEDFFCRTRPQLPTKLHRFHNDLVIRYVQKIEVTDNGYNVHFKAGVVIRV